MADKIADRTDTPALMEPESGSSLSGGEVRARLESLDLSTTDVTDRMYSLGSKLVDANVELSSHLDTKAATVIGYSGAVLGFLIHISPKWTVLKVCSWQWVLIWLVTLCAISSAGASFFALLVQSYDWFSDFEWFNSDVLNNSELQKRYFILSMHRVNASYLAVNTKRARSLRWGQIALAAAVALLTALLIGNLLASHPTDV